MIIFVDIAQCLRRNQDLIGLLLCTGFSYCLAFSPTTADGEGDLPTIVALSITKRSTFDLFLK